MSTYICTLCGFLYDPEKHLPSGIDFADLPEDWVCPVCGAAKAKFKKD